MRKLHEKKHMYIDDLHHELSMILDKQKTVISNIENSEGYYVAFGAKYKDPIKKTEHLRPDATIILEANAIDDMTLRMLNHDRNRILQEFPVHNDYEYIISRNNLCDYIKKNFLH
ncbi:MAG: hypothetical protein ACP5NW_05250 [Candidatus Woesearchaeota archaeon]